MTALFDGMGGALIDTFGAPLVILSAKFGWIEPRGMVRREPVEVQDDQGRVVLTAGPTLRLTREDAEKVSRGDIVTAPDGRKYRVMAGIESGSPASDRLVTFDLEDDPA